MTKLNYFQQQTAIDQAIADLRAVGNSVACAHVQADIDRALDILVRLSDEETLILNSEVRK